MTGLPARLECRASMTKSAGLVAMTAGLLAACWFCTTLPAWDAQAVGWFGLAFFGLAGVAVARQVARVGPVVVIDADGLDDRRTGLGPVPWAEVTAVRTVSHKGTSFLCLTLADPDRYAGRLPRWKRVAQAANRRLGYGDLSVGFVGLTPGVDDAGDAVRRWVRNRP